MTNHRVRRLIPPLVLLSLVGILLASPAAAQPLPMPRVVSTAEPLPMPRVVDPRGPLAVEEYLTPPNELLHALLATRRENVSLNNTSPVGQEFPLTEHGRHP